MLPESTSLERAIKNHYLGGKAIYEYFGCFFCLECILVKSHNFAYTIHRWNYYIISFEIFFKKGVAFLKNVWYNIVKENGLVVRPGSTCGGDVPRHFL